MNRIFVCLDSSPRAPFVLSTAIDLARKTGGKVMLFRAVGLPPEVPSHLYSISPNDLDLMLVTDSVPEATRHIERHAIDRFGLTTAARPSPWRVLGERALNVGRRPG